jgi:hypothetical protein
MAEHSDLTDPELHEPKGVSSASVNTVYVADGAGSGAWQKIEVAQLDYADLTTELQGDLDSGDLDIKAKFFLYAKIDDVSTPSSIIIPVRINSTFKGATAILGAAISGADAAVSFKDSLGGSQGTDMTVAYSGSAKGNAFSFTATSNNTFTAPSWMEIATDGASTDPAPLYLILEFEGVLNG